MAAHPAAQWARGISMRAVGEFGATFAPFDQNLAHGIPTHKLSYLAKGLAPWLRPPKTRAWARRTRTRATPTATSTASRAAARARTAGRVARATREIKVPWAASPTSPRTRP